MDGVGLSHAIRSKQVSCVEVMTTYLDHIAIFNPQVNAIVSMQPREASLAQANERDAQLARGEYLGWMHGLPHAVKDNMPVKGMPFTRGSPLFKDFIAPADAIVVERMKSAGAIIIGKTNMPEFAWLANPQHRVRYDPQSLRSEQDLRWVQRWCRRRSGATDAAGGERH